MFVFLLPLNPQLFATALFQTNSTQIQFGQSFYFSVITDTCSHNTTTPD